MAYTREKRLINQMEGKAQLQNFTPVATDMFLPNHSGDHSAGIVNSTPVNPTDLVNKEYVDNHTHQKQWNFTILNPFGDYDIDTQIFIAWARDALTITKIQIELDSAANEVAGDLKYADDFLALGNATVINDFDTTSGKRTDTSITSGSVASGKAIYLQFDSQPNAAIKQMHVHIEWEF
jgi:hypothetical protein